MKTHIACAICAVLAGPTMAQVQVDPATEQLVQTTTDQFFAHLSANAYDAQYVMMSPRLSQQLTFDAWKAIGTDLAAEMGGTPDQYIAHRSTYYDQGRIVVAVDYSAQGSNPDQVVCGFVLWDIEADNRIAFSRFEQNLVVGELFRKSPPDQAAQLMADWYCPVPVIERMLNVKLQ